MAGYEIYRNEVKVGTTSITYYTDTGLTTGKTYSYTVKAFDASGNISKASIAINGVPLKPEIAKVDPVDMSLFGGAVDQQLRIYCTMSSERSVKKATVEYSTDNINWTTIGNMQGSEATLEDTQYFLFTYYWDIRPLKTGEYKVRYTAYDDAGACESKIVTYEIDKDAPSAPKNLKVVSVYGEVQLSWEVPIDSDVSGYIIYRSDSETGRYLPMQEISGRITCYYTDFAVTDGVTYYYKVMAIDKFGQEGLPSNVVYAKVVGSDIIKPVVKQINPPNGSVIAKSATITVEATDNNMVSTIKLQYSLDKGQTWVDASIGVIQGTNKAQFNWTTPEINGEIMVRAIAVDRAGNESDGEPVRTYIIDRKGPSKVTGLKAIPSSTSIILNWDDVPDADFSYFEVECLDDKGIFNLVGRVSNRRGIVLDGLKPNTSYTYRVCAYDIYGNRGQVSDEICVRTSEDVSIPVVRYLGPASDRYSQSIMLSANIYDDTSIASVLFQVSTDNVNWTDIHYIENSGNNSSFSWNYDVSKLPEGKIYIRCLARDTKGNESSGSPVNEYIIDHTAPAKPSNVQVTTDAGYINLRWTRGNESDLKNYKIYRSVNNGPYSVIQTGYGYLDYTDRNVQANLSYKYRITAVDISGNESEAYETSTVILPKDSTKPQIHSVSYKNNSTLPANPKISVLAEDNYLLESVRMKYRRADSSEEWIVGDIIKGINSYSSVVEFLWNTDELTDGNYEVVFIAKDINGLESDEYKVTYNLNIMPPKATVLKAVPSGWKIELQWDKNTEPDLAGYHILRGNAYDGEFVLIGKTTNTSYIDTKVEAGATYYYVVESVDKYLNKSRSNIVSGIPTEDDDEKPVAVIKADRFSTTNTYILFDSTASIDNHKVEDVLWDFGDGTQSTEWKAYHKYSEPGDYTVSLAVYDSARNYSTTQHVIRIYDSALTSKVNIQVIDDSTALGLSNADVIAKMPDGSEESFITDESGFIYLLIPFTNEQDIGNLTVYAFTTGYRPAKKEIQVSAGVSNNVVIRIVKDKLVEGELTFRRMTLDEVKAAGLDIKAPENQYVYSFNIHLGYTVVCNSFGQIANNSTYIIREYDSTTNSNKTTNVYVNAIPSKDVKRPPTIVYIELPGDVSMLKEFFMVNLRVKNLAEDEEFVIEDAKAKLNVPSGLTIVKGNAEQNLTPKDIPGGSEGNSSWIVRGDKKGSYNLSADFSGVLQPFDEQISATFTSKNPIVVEEESGLRVIIEVESQKYVNDKLLYRVGLKNERKSDVNMPNISMQNSTLIRRYKTTEDMSLKNTSLEVLKSKEIIWSEFYVNPNVFNGLNNKSLQLVEYAAEALGNEDLPIEIRPVEYGTFGRIKPRIYVIDPVTGIEYECISLDLIRYRSKENDIMPDLKIKTSRGISDGVEVQEVCEIKIVDRVFNVTKIVLTDANGEYIYKGGSIDNVKIEYPGVETYTIEVSADMGITDYQKVRIIDQNLLPKEVFGNVSGYVWNKDNNQPVIGAEVIIGSATTLTGEKGLFEFKDIMLDSDKITVRANGFPEKVEKVELSDGSFVKIDLSILPEITEVRSHYSSSKNKRSSIIPVNIIPDTIYFFIETDLKGDGEVIKYLYKIEDRNGNVKYHGESEWNFVDIKNIKNLMLPGDRLLFAVQTKSDYYGDYITKYVDSKLVMAKELKLLNGINWVVDIMKEVEEYRPGNYIKNIRDSITGFIKYREDKKGEKIDFPKEIEIFKYYWIESANREFDFIIDYDFYNAKATITAIAGKESAGYAEEIGRNSKKTIFHIKNGQEVNFEVESTIQAKLNLVIVYDDADLKWGLESINIENEFGVIGNVPVKFPIPLKYGFSGYILVEFGGEINVFSEVSIPNISELDGIGDLVARIKSHIFVYVKGAIGIEALKGLVGADLFIKGNFCVDVPSWEADFYLTYGLDYTFVWGLIGDEVEAGDIGKKENDEEGEGDVKAQSISEEHEVFYSMNNEDKEVVFVNAPRDYLKNQRWIGKEEIMQYAYPNSDAQIAGIDNEIGDLIMVYVGDDKERSDSNRTSVYSSVFCDGKWSQPVQIENDGTGDAFPSLSADGKDIYAAWLDMSKPIGEITTITMEDFNKNILGEMGVSIAKYDAIKNKWHNVLFEKTEGLKKLPKIATKNGRVISTWVNNTGMTSIGNNVKPDNVYYVYNDGTGWTEPQVFIKDAANIYDCDLLLHEDKAY